MKQQVKSQVNAAGALPRPDAGNRGITVKTTNGFVLGTLAVAVLLGLSACSGMSTRDRNTAIGAGVGAVGGSVLTGGSAAGTIGGAAVGGVIGNQVGK